MMLGSMVSVPMDIKFIGYASQAHASTPVTCTTTGISNQQAGDLMIAILASDTLDSTTGATGTVNGAFTVVSNTNASYNRTLTVSAKVLTAAETGLTATSFTGNYNILAAFVFRNAAVDGADWDSAGSSTGTTVQINPPESKRIVVPGEMVLACGMTDDVGVTITAPPSGYTTCALIDSGLGRTALGVAYKVVTASGSKENPGTFSKSGGTDYWEAHTGILTEA